ncbi:MAG: hypothetical protein MUC96_27280 [Myxococcaceae bacterium]|nr:hypothetical protein [Myxococcaceae bacterium]
MRLVLLVALLLAARVVRADTPTDGMGRISVGGTLRLTPNDYFNGKAAEAGRELVADGTTSPFGAGGVASFGYGAFEYFEVAIDLYAAWEAFVLQGLRPFSSTNYGILLGFRVTRYDVLFKGFAPYVGAQTGLSLATVTSPDAPGSERALQPWSVNGGFAWRFTDRLGIFLDVRYLLSRLYVADIAGRNVGGVFVSAGLAIFFPSATERRDTNEVPGFSRPPLQ